MVFDANVYRILFTAPPEMVRLILQLIGSQLLVVLAKGEMRNKPCAALGRSDSDVPERPGLYPAPSTQIKFWLFTVTMVAGTGEIIGFIQSPVIRETRRT